MGPPNNKEVKPVLTKQNGCVRMRWDINLNGLENVWYCITFLNVWVFDFLTLTSKLSLPFPNPAWSPTWLLEVSIGSPLLASDRASFMEDLSTPWCCCCLFVFLTAWSWCISAAEDRFWSGPSSSRRLGGLLDIFLLCCCISGGICSGSGLSSSGGGSSTETRLATREDGSTAVTTRVTLRGKGAWGR